MMVETNRSVTWPGVVLAIFVLVAVGLTLLGVLSPPHGVATVTRLLLAGVGLLGAVHLLRGRPGWFRPLLIWSIAQIPVIILDTSGSLTGQSFYLHVVQTRVMTANGRVVEMSGAGINFVGVACLAAVLIIQRRGLYRRQNSPPMPPQEMDRGGGDW